MKIRKQKLLPSPPWWCHVLEGFYPGWGSVNYVLWLRRRGYK